MQKGTKHIVSISGGKDSTAMLLRMLEEEMPVDIILFCDTGLEFEAMYRHIDKLERYIGQEALNISSSTICPSEEIPNWKADTALVGRDRITAGAPL